MLSSIFDKLPIQIHLFQHIKRTCIFLNDLLPNYLVRIDLFLLLGPSLPLYHIFINLLFYLFVATGRNKSFKVVFAVNRMIYINICAVRRVQIILWQILILYLLNLESQVNPGFFLDLLNQIITINNFLMIFDDIHILAVQIISDLKFPSLILFLPIFIKNHR